ncbi:nucleoside deaminase [Legionella maioricensis]|uniref:Nucleoside deaminase n=1 Tax=Legionella maioricensis TaxID=2896528 RepID=A0A9X2I9D6_9GAMM|nr:nucleoside deaminase [Legionella maioricensis]MCL9682970.1 nucleoside deaminase [Legionella maioricensis]MCL9686318.1 nucleoside deaminase [Legionella maioricensis]
MLSYFELALKEAMQGVENGDGAPFGACIVNKGQIIALAHDTVLKENDATCHAEMNAIRIASKNLANYQLGSSIIYCTSEPCPMCLSAIHWSGIKQCYFIADKKCAAEYGFDDDLLYNELIKPISQRKMFIEQQTNLYNEVKNLFDCWKEKGLPLC